MSKYFSLSLFVVSLALLLGTGCAQRAAPDGTSGAGAPAEGKIIANRALLWSDEFSGTELNAADWNFELGDGCPNLCGWGNNELQLYTKSNHELIDGKLVITVRKEGDRYTSTRITTQNKRTAKYGRIEARAKLPVGSGLWPAFWMLGENIGEVGWPLCGEIDILEYVGRKPGEVFTTLHTKAGHGDDATGKVTPWPNVEEGFHVYACEWTPEDIVFSVDGRTVFTFDPKARTEAVWPFDQPFYVLLNVAVGGNFGGPEVDDAVFPQQFVVDYVRIYEPL